MPQYCDSAKLERNWFYWILAESVPELERYRELGLLWTKIIGKAANKDGSLIYRHGQTLPDPSYPERAHCIALGSPIYFSHHSSRTKISLHSVAAELNLLSNSPLHRLDVPLYQYTTIIPHLKANGYIKELPVSVTWHAVLHDINNMCQGIAKKFSPKSEDDHFDLANEALLQVANKLVNHKLVYTPGRAPVFNLLTTTIHRCIFSILNRRKQQREGLSRLMTDIQAGMIPRHRSLRHATSAALATH